INRDERMEEIHSRAPAADRAVQGVEEEDGGARLGAVRNGKRGSGIPKRDIKHCAGRRTNCTATGRRGNGYYERRTDWKPLAEAIVEGGFPGDVVAAPKGTATRSREAPGVDQVWVRRVGNQIAADVLGEC